MPYLFAATLFVSAALLFWAEPLVGKMVLPYLGGSPAVWNTCLVFFQAALLIGYLYAHASAALLKPRAQAMLHIALLAAATIVLPIALPKNLVESLTASPDPVPWLLTLLTLMVGLPFVVVAGSAPLLQRWFAASGHPDGRDPYFLYAASNLGSMIALLGFPLLLEPLLTLRQQSTAWAIGFGILLVLTASCAIAAWHPAPTTEPEPQSDDLGRPPTVRRRMRWVLLSLVPSSLLLGVTAYVTTDLAAVPLLWVIPLALYLLTFILVFSRRQLIPHAWMVRALPVLALLAAFSLVRSSATPSPPLIGLHWLVLFTASMVCHGELAKDRPAARFLTGYYLCISLGGVLGGLLTPLAAPLLFQGAVLEYPLAVILACLLRPGPGLRDSASFDRWLDLLLPGAVGLLCVTLGLQHKQLESEFPDVLVRLVMFGLPALVCWMLAARPVRFALAFGIMVVILAATQGEGGRMLHVRRNFFGILRVHDDRARQFRFLSHGSTQHGLQRLGPDGQPGAAPEPLAYFHASGPIGQVFEVFRSRCGAGLPPRVAVTGLGVGALASYARPGESWTYYEIDPDIVDAAQRYFSFLKHCKADKLDILTGDARLRLHEAEQPYGLLILDAFSSDAVPTHLLTREALRLYNDKRAPGGLLVFNVSNRYLNLHQVLADLAKDAGMVSYGRRQSYTKEEKDAGLTDSQWVVLVDKVEDLGVIGHDGRWERLEGRNGVKVWDDDFSNLLEAFRWRE